MKERLPREFYLGDAVSVAKAMLGKFLVRRIGMRTLVGKIVETEAYVGPEDRAIHAYGGKVTPRNRTEYMQGGHIYIYLCYGMYWQLNVTTGPEGHPQCVLIRALEPKLPTKKQKNKSGWELARSSLEEIRRLTAGPGRLCRWMQLDKSFDAEDLTTSKRIWLEDRCERIDTSQIVATTRIGIDYAGEWATKPLRFYVKNSPFVSRK